LPPTHIRPSKKIIYNTPKSEPVREDDDYYYYDEDDFLEENPKTLEEKM